MVSHPNLSASCWGNTPVARFSTLTPAFPPTMAVTRPYIDGGMIGIAIGASSKATSTSREMYVGFSQPQRGLLAKRSTINDPAANSIGYAGARKYSLARL